MSMNSEPSSVFANVGDTAGKTYMLHFLPNFIVAFNTVSVILNCSVILKAVYHYDETSNATRPYLMMMHLPFVHNQPVYLIVILLQFSYLLVLTAAATTINSVLIILVQYLSGQIDVICKSLMQMSQRQNERMANVTMVKEIIRKHQNVITFSENIESLYTYIALILLLLNTLIICGLGFILVTSMGSPNSTKMLIKNLLFYCAINMETFVFCFAGEYISAKSKEIGEAAYSSPWYQSKFHGSAVLFLIMRSQNQLTITMGKFLDLSLERFSTIVKASASYLSVLLALY
ncbi:PREDICTED: odorant receptor 4-like [Dinoponera quadriceps]|uniref:Odorant receptor 4-like n=1 Tax=Dinoponera quadriceps TaxID=609295 RepID=A0A6P3XNI5_DINQU|nr:PREDICTED: odorant receptor 4-like [Dinoponera quadriceps]